MKKYDIVIIDTGVKETHPCVRTQVDGIHIHCGKLINNSISDNIGHGTAIYTIIKQETDNAKIFMIKIIDNISNEQDESSLITALDFIYDNIDCFLVNISLGIVTPHNNNKLLKICKKLSEKNIVLVAAFDNFGAVTYPSFYDCVIGVTSDLYCRKKNDFTFYNDKNVNIAGNGNTQRVAWIKPDYIFINGNSFACAHVTSFLYNGIKCGECLCNLNYFF